MKKILLFLFCITLYSSTANATLSNDEMPKSCENFSILPDDLRVACLNKHIANNIAGVKELRNFVVTLKKFYKKYNDDCKFCEQYLNYIAKLEANPSHYGFAYIRLNKIGKKSSAFFWKYEPVGFVYSVGRDKTLTRSDAIKRCGTSVESYDKKLNACFRILEDTQFTYDGAAGNVIFDLKASKAFYKNPDMYIQPMKVLISNINDLNQSEVIKQFTILNADKNLDDHSGNTALQQKEKPILQTNNEETKKQLVTPIIKPELEPEVITKTNKAPTSKGDKDAPVLKIQDRITVTDRSYSITGTVKDASAVFIEANGSTWEVYKNTFTITGSTPFGLNEVEVIAFDAAGNETSKKIIIERKIQTVSNDLNFEKLKPEKLNKSKNKNRIALVIGMEEYKNISPANYATNDAKFFIDYVQGAFGVSESNIKYFFDAKLEAKFEIKKWLKKNVGLNTEVYVFFSGHGMALNEGKDLHLLTSDTLPDFIEETSFNRNEIFNDIAQYNPKSVIAFLDTCYSGAGRADGEMLLAMAKGLVVVDEQQQLLPDNFTLFTAASAQESAWSLPEAKHGTFSYFLMKGMEGAADLNDDKKLTNGELQEYLLDNVGRFAQQQQTPQMIGDPNQVLVQF